MSLTKAGGALSPDDADKILETLTKEQILPVLRAAVLRHQDVLDSLLAVAGSVRDLGRETTTDKLRQVSPAISSGKNSGKSRGYGITFRDSDAVSLALRNPFPKIDGRIITVNGLTSAGSSGAAPRTIFVSGIPFAIPPEWLSAYFSTFGEIEDGPIGFDRQNPKVEEFASFFKTKESHNQKFKDAKPKSFSNNKTEALNLDDDDDGNSDCVALDDANHIKGSDDFTILPQASNKAKEFHIRRPTAGTLKGRQGSSSSFKIPDEFYRPPKRSNNAGSLAASASSRIDDSVFQRTGSSITSRQFVKRYFQSLRNPSVEAVGSSEIRGMHGKSTTWPNSSNGNNSMKEISIDNDLLLHETRGNRQLLPTLMPGKYSAPATFVGSNDPFYHTGVAEESPAGVDERNVFQAAVQDLHQPKVEANLPNGLLSVPLLRHQKIALAWMLSKESSGFCLGGILADDQGLGKTVSTIALIMMQKFKEAKPKNSSNNKTEALNLDDDDDGNSDCVALDDANHIKGSDDFTILPQASNTVKGFHSSRPTAGTLIVCPASVIRQWHRELDEKVTDEAKLSVLIYHGGNRTKDPATLAGYDVVLTTYAIVANELPKQSLDDEDDNEHRDGDRCGISSAFSTEKKRKKSSVGNNKTKKGKKEIDLSAFDGDNGTLAKVKWSRVVLDESQTIKNYRTQVARACCSLRAERRWCLSGTPIQNSVDELYSYFRFLRYDPYDKFKVFGSTIRSLIIRDSAKGYKKIQDVLRKIMLRRTKGTLLHGEPIINLPPKKVDLARVEFSIEERTFYDQLESDYRKQYKAYAAAGTLNQNYANILLMLLRLRQACDHPLLVKGLTYDPVGNVSSQMAQMLPRELLVNLLEKLETPSAICLVCRDLSENAVVTMCGHVFCYQCVSDNLTGEDNTCPVPSCKEQLGADVVYSRATLTKCISDEIDGDKELGNNLVVLQKNFMSSKIKSALEILKSHCVSNGRRGLVRYDGASSSESRGEEPEKAIVFSQWTSMLDLVEMSLKKSCISYRRLDGSMSIADRDKCVKDFNTDPEVDVMLMSLQAGNLGLNMVAASRVILLDIWWNPTTEDQAVDRVHRIGQTRPVTVSRLTIKGTVEVRILELQDDKRKMVASAFGEDQSSGHGIRLTEDDLRKLFG